MNCAVELGFGKHVLGESLSKSYFDMVSVRCSPHNATTAAPCRMDLERILSRAAAREHVAIDTTDASSMSTGDISLASTQHIGAIRSIRCRINGEPEILSVPILRSLRVSSPVVDSRFVHSWVEYDTTKTAEERPHFSFKEVQTALSACNLPLPQFSGRWRLEEVGDYPGFSAYTIIAIPFAETAVPLQAAAAVSSAARLEEGTDCLVVALQSNDSEEWKYEHFLVGRGRVEGAGTEDACRITATLRRVRLQFSPWIKDVQYETLHGTPDRLHLSSGLDLVRIVTPAAAADSQLHQEAEVLRMLRNIVPEKLDFRDAVNAGDAARVAELVHSPNHKPDLTQQIEFDSRHAKRAVPIVAAALQGRAAVVEVLLQVQLPLLDGWTLTCVASCSPLAAKELFALLESAPHLRACVCPGPEDTLLASLDMTGCTLVEVAVLAGGAALAREQVARGWCEHTLASAVQSGDAAWLKANAQKWAVEVDEPFLTGRATLLVAGFTPLIAAVAARNVAVVECLLQHGANPFVCRLERRGGQWIPLRSTAINYAQASTLLTTE